MTPPTHHAASPPAWIAPLCCAGPPPRRPLSTHTSPRSPLLRAALRALRARLPQLFPPPPASPPPSPEEWRALIIEFEDRADARYAPSTQPPPGPLGRLNPAQFESLPFVSCAAMSALTTTTWYFGRMMRLDAFLLLLYPLPTMYIAARWGLRYADLALMSSTFLIYTIMGPMYAGLFFLNTGLLTLTYARALWYRASWKVTLLAASAAKAVGLALQLAWVSVILQYNAWQAAAIQVSSMISFMGKVVNKVLGRAICGTPAIGAVKIGLAILVTVHSLYHVLFTLITISILLRKVDQDLERTPPDVPGVNWLLRKSTLRKDKYR